MTKFNSNMRSYMQTQKDRQKHTKARTIEPSEICRKYLREHQKFDWFLEKYFGTKKVLELWDLATNQEENVLLQEMEYCWQSLPESVFNTYSNPRGYEEFVSILIDGYDTL